jgi:hypothetical protein
MRGTSRGRREALPDIRESRERTIPPCTSAAGLHH